MDDYEAGFPDRLKKRGAAAAQMYYRKHPTVGVNSLPWHLSSAQFAQHLSGAYVHGTDADLAPGDMVTSPASRGDHRATASSPQASSQATAGVEHAVFAAHDKYKAGNYGDNAYEVEPTGHVFPDNEDPAGGVMSYAPMRVTKRA